MKLWTIQPYSVWEFARQHGSVRVDRSRCPGGEKAPASYLWLRAQLKSRVEGYEGGFPWWLYCSKPDLRLHRHGRLPGGQHQVRLELKVCPARVKVFRIWAWDKVFCGQYLGTRRQEREWSKRRGTCGIDPDLRDWELDGAWRSELESSWERLFTYLRTRLNAFGKPGGSEAVLEVIRRDDIIKVDEFFTTYSASST